MNVQRPRAGELTALLAAWSLGSDTALDQLVPEIYEDLHRIARMYMAGERADHTLQPTALVHETFLRLVDQQGVRWQSRAHFRAIAATVMKRLLLQHARGKRAAKRDPGFPLLSLDQLPDVALPRAPSYEQLGHALAELRRLDPRQGRVVELRILFGLTEAEIAEEVGVSIATVKRDWRLAKAWLRRELDPPPPENRAGTPIPLAENSG